MQATEILKSEHRVIEQVLACLEQIAAEAGCKGRLDAADARDATEFLRGFADQCHHGKEEAQLFPMMEERGFSPEAGPTAVMRAEHEQGRAHVRAMNEAIEAAAHGDAEAAATFAAHADAYIGLLREHIQKEDHCLFGMADQALDAVAQAELMKRFEHVEHEEMGEGTHEHYLAIADRLAAKYGVAKATGAGGASCCHHH